MIPIIAPKTKNNAGWIFFSGFIWSRTSVITEKIIRFVYGVIVPVSETVKSVTLQIPRIAIVIIAVTAGLIAPNAAFTWRFS